MQSQILRIPSGHLDNVNDPAIGQAVASPGSQPSKFAGQLGMEIELRQDMIWLKNPAVPVAAGWFQYVRLAPGSAVPAVGATVNWDATADKRAYQVTASAGTAAGTALTANVTPGNYTIIQTKVSVPTGTLSVLPRMASGGGDEGEGEAPEPAAAPAARTASRTPASR